MMMDEKEIAEWVSAVEHAERNDKNWPLTPGLADFIKRLNAERTYEVVKVVGDWKVGESLISLILTDLRMPTDNPHRLNRAHRRVVIVHLRNLGWTYREIQDAIGCSKDTIARALRG
jgi:hypothetical protein